MNNQLTLSDFIESATHAFSVGPLGKLKIKKEYEMSLWTRITLGVGNINWLKPSHPSDTLLYRLTGEILEGGESKIVVLRSDGEKMALPIYAFLHKFPDAPINPQFLYEQPCFDK